MANNKIKSAILDVVNEQDRPINRRALFGIMVKTHKDIGFVHNDDFESSLDELAKEGKINILSKTGMIAKPRTTGNIDLSNKMEGTIHLNNAGNGFITIAGEEKARYYVYKLNMSNAQNGDTIEFATTDRKMEKEGGLIDAVVTKIISHAKDFYVGTFHKEQNGYKVALDDLSVSLDIKLDSTDGLVEGTKILIQIAKYEGNVAYGTVSRIIGHASDVGVDILSIVYDNGVEPDFPDPVLAYAKEIKLDVNEQQKKIRKDLTEWPIITIDPATSKDFDDAFYCKKQDDGKFFLSVSIADVSHYVSYDSILDKEALKRGCSIYLVDRVIPMLPHNLSDDICSINPNVLRMAITCDMIINTQGTFDDIKVYPSIIKSHRRYSYDEVNEFVEGKTKLENDEIAVVESIKTGLELSKVLSAYKEKRGYIDFHIPEPIIKVNEKCEPIEIISKVQGVAQKMIEDFMVAANEAVTIFADKMNYPFIYRIHDKPDEDRIKTFALEAKKLGFRITTSIDDVKPTDVEKWLEDNKDNKNIDLINMMLLRSMAKAKYDTTNIGHFGLGSKNYTHFTSPIRRYPDLMVHRIFWMYDFAKNETSSAARGKFTSELKDDCDLSSKNELIAVKCERDVDSMKFAEYMSKHIGESYDVTVTNVSPFGVFVQLDNSIQGLIRIANLGNDFFTFNDKTYELVGKNTGLRLTLGSKLNVELIVADKYQRKIEFKLNKFLSNR